MPQSTLTLVFIALVFGLLPTGNAQELKALTYNIRYLNNSDGKDHWRFRKEAVIRTIQASDVVGLQEVVEKQLKTIRSRTPDLTWYGVGRNDGELDGEMTPIGFQTSKFDLLDKGTFWLSPAPNKVGKAGWDAALPRIASWVTLRSKESGVQFLFANTHFDHKGAIARKNSAQQISRWLASQTHQLPHILVGDFNAQLNDPPIRELLRDETSLILAEGQEPPKGPNSTWNGFKAIVSGRRIDHIFVNKRIQVAQITTLNPKTSDGRFASDHLPVQMHFRLTKEK